MYYQSHAGHGPGVSDSELKLKRLRLPGDLSGKSFLDVGCNEGFFCGEAVKRGASRVVGLDRKLAALEMARNLYPGPEFIQASWLSLPDGPFDVILWASAMHYEADPASVLKEIHRRLSPDGMLILECGAFDRSGKELTQVQRGNDTRWYPTIRLLKEEFLRDYTVRWFRDGELTKGDPVHRYVFHCCKRKTSVLVVRGASKDGKSTLSETLSPAATKQVTLDLMLAQGASREFHHTDIQKAIRDLVRQNKGLDIVYQKIDEMGLTGQFAAMIAEAIAPSDRLVVIDGVVSDALFDALRRKLDFAAVWQATR